MFGGTYLGGSYLGGQGFEPEAIDGTANPELEALRVEASGQTSAVEILPEPIFAGGSVAWSVPQIPSIRGTGRAKLKPATVRARGEIKRPLDIDGECAAMLAAFTSQGLGEITEPQWRTEEEDLVLVGAFD